MNTALIGELVQLRYKLLWAKTRSRNGRIALFLAGYLLLVMLIGLLASGGFGAAMLAVRSGKAEPVAQGVLAALFLQAVLAANILGFGMSAIFAETELRRYPLNAADRRIARHLTGILDPFWFLFLALELGLAVGLYVMGAGSFWFGFVAVLLLFAANYLLARVVGLFIDQLIERKGGATVLMGLIMVLAFLPSVVVAPLIKKNSPMVAAMVQRLQYTPPFGAAAAMIHPDLAGAYGLATIVVWIFGLAALLVWLEKRPPQRQVSESVKIEWDSPFDRVGALFGPHLGPLVGHWLRFYGRNSRTRTMSLISLPLLTFLTFQLGHMSKAPHGLFVIALGTFPMVTFLGVARTSVNQFGYVGGAFRRYFLLPIDPAATLRAASYAGVIIGASLLPIALLAWAIFVPFDARMLFMLLCTGLTGMFVLHGLGVWVTLYNPRKGNYNSNFGNDLSLGGNVVLIGGMMIAMFLPRLLYYFQPAWVSPESWWMFLPLPVLALAFYLATLKSAGPVFVTRREKLLAIVEGRN